MAKQGEIDYLKNAGIDGIRHAVNKPFSDEYCAGYLMEMGAIMSLLPPPPARLLDLGCGTGWTSCFYARRGYEVTGQDIAEDMIYNANEKKNREGINNVGFVVCDYESMDFESEFDCAVFFDALHHSINEEDAIRMVYKALKPGGICIASEPGIGHANMPRSIDAVRKYNVTEKDMPPGRIIKAGRKAGFRVYKVYPHTMHLEKTIYAGRTDRRWVNKLFRWRFLRTLTAIFVMTLYKRRAGIVLMIK